MESGDLHDLCGNDMTDVDCDNSQNDSTVENLADCDNSQDNASEIDANIDVNNQFDDMKTANFAVVGVASLLSDANSSSYLIPVQNNVFCSVFTHEECLMIWFGQVCTDANVPLYLVDELVKILTDESECGLRMDDICIRGRKSFMHHLLKWFQCPKAHLQHIGIESFHPLGINYRRDYRDSVSIVYYNFLEQVHDLLNDISIWGDKSNFKGTINMEDPFSNEPIHVDGCIDEIVDAEWYKKNKCSM